MSLGFCMPGMSVCHGDQQIGKYQPAFNPDYINQPSLPRMHRCSTKTLTQTSWSSSRSGETTFLFTWHSPGGVPRLYTAFLALSLSLSIYIYILSCITLFKLLVPSTRVEVKYASQQFQRFSAPIFLMGHIFTCSNCQASLTDACS